MNLPSFTLGKSLPKVEFGRTGALLAPAGAILISVIVLVLVVWPKFTQALAIRGENQQLNGRVSVLEAKAGILESLDRDQLQEQLSNSERLLPSDKSVFPYIRQIEGAAAGAGVILNKVDVAPGALSTSNQAPVGAPAPASGQNGAGTEPAEAVNKVQVKVAITSDYKSLVNFMERIAGLARVSGVRDLTIASSGTLGETAPLRSSMVIDAYFRPLPAELGSVEAPVEMLSAAEEGILTAVRIAEISAPAATTSAVLPVPTGRSDLFAPF